MVRILPQDIITRYPPAFLIHLRRSYTRITTQQPTVLLSQLQECKSRRINWRIMLLRLPSSSKGEAPHLSHLLMASNQDLQERTEVMAKVSTVPGEYPDITACHARGSHSTANHPWQDTRGRIMENYATSAWPLSALDVESSTPASLRFCATSKGRDIRDVESSSSESITGKM